MYINGEKYRATRKVLESWLIQQTGIAGSEAVYVDDFNPKGTRHCCPNFHAIIILPPRSLTYADEDGRIDINFYVCQNCGKYIIQKNGVS